MDATRRFADFLCGLKYEDLPEVAIGKAKLCLLDWIGVAVAAFVSEKSKMGMMFSTLRPFFGQPQATLLTRRTKADLINAALINGTAAHLLDYDDVYFPSTIHPSAAVIPSALTM